MKSPSFSSSSSSVAGPTDRYEARVATGDILPDEGQVEALQALDVLWAQLIRHPVSGQGPRTIKTWIRAFAGITKKESPKGIYLYGGVGRGKTMLMDLFYQSLPEDIAKARWHFHAFMLKVHDSLHQAQKIGARALDDVLIDCADQFSKSMRVLCFDELVVRDVADAMLLSRLFERMIENDTVIVFTSNTAPDNLYEGGWQRERFLPFIALLNDTMTIVEIGGQRDFRTRNLTEDDLYLDSAGTNTREKLEADFRALTGGQAGAPLAMLVKGHALDVPRAAGRVAWFGFDDLCARPLAAVDYLALCERFDSFIIDNIPVLGEAKRNEAKRFIALVDALYDTRRRLIVSAAAEPGELYKGTDHAGEFTRTKSRLKEMRTKAYWDRAV